MIPSRHMPPRDTSSDVPFLANVVPFGFIALGILVLVQFWTHNAWLGAGITGLVSLGVWESWRDSRRQEQFLRDRSGENTTDGICRFARSFDRHEVDPWVVRAVYEELSAWLARSDLPFVPRAEDHLFDELRLDPDDLDLDMVPAICARIGRSLEGFADNPFAEKVETVADLAHFLNAQPKTVAP